MGKNDQVIQDLVKKIGDKYPHERIAKSMVKYNQLWDIHQSFHIPPIALHRGTIMDGKRHPAYHTQDEMYNTLIRELRHIVNLADIQDDYIPALTMETGAYIIGESFDAPRFYQDNMYFIKPIIHTATDVDNMPDFDPEGTNYYMNKVFEMLRFMQDKTQGELFINIHGVQGPIDTLETLWESNDFFTSLLLHPDKVSRAISKLKPAFHYYLSQQYKILGDNALSNFALQYTYRPKNTGIGIGEDQLATISPDILDLVFPFYQFLADEFGGLLIHSCGNPSHHIETLCKQDYIRGFQFSQLQPENYFPLMGPRRVIQSRNDWTDLVELEQYIRSARNHSIRYALQFQSLGEYMQKGDNIDDYDIDKMKELFIRVRELVRKHYE